jgi:hypothetical protein
VAGHRLGRHETFSCFRLVAADLLALEPWSFFSV